VIQSCSDCASRSIEGRIAGQNPAHAQQRACPGTVPGSSRSGCSIWSNSIPGAEDWNLDAFLLAFDQDARYDSPNFLWFCARYPRFVYVDRIVVRHRRAGAAARAGSIAICSSMRLKPDTSALSVSQQQPSKPASDAFHAALGFVRSARQASMMAAARSGICRTRCKDPNIAERGERQAANTGTSFRGARSANPESRDSPMCNCTSESGPSDHPE